MRAVTRSLAAATGFLTRLPVPHGEDRGAGELRAAAAWFPLVGLAVVGLAVATRWALAAVWGPLVGTIVAVLAAVAVTGALHEDGMADTADGLWGGRDAPRRIEIMRDSRIGTYGVVALVALLGLRVALLAPLDVGAFARALACGAVLGRGSVILLAARLPAASTHGAGVQVVGRAAAGTVAVAGLTVAVTLLTATGYWAWLPLVAALAVSAACAVLFRRRLGGVTGDAFGAAICAVDMAAIASVSALSQRGLV